MLILLVGIIIISFVAGLVIIFLGYKEIPDIEAAQLVEIETNLTTSQKTGEKLNSELISIKKELAETQANLQQARDLEKVVAALREEKNSYKESLNKLDGDLKGVTGKADQQAQNALELIESLRQENEALKTIEEKIKGFEAVKQSEEKLRRELDLLKKQHAEAQEGLEEKKKLEEFSSTLKSVEAQYKENTRKLEEDIQLIAAKADRQARDAVELIKNLQEENKSISASAPMKVTDLTPAETLPQALGPLKGEDALAAAEKKAEDEIRQQTEEIENLRKENLTLNQQVNDSLERMRHLEQEMESLRAAGTAQTPEARQDDSDVQKLYADFRGQLEQIRQKVNDLKTVSVPEEEHPAEGDLESQQKLRKLKEMNNFLMEREKILQLELTKSRVQALGLKRICEDFKIQLDQMHKKS
ncbi:MAG: hypothetical protein WC552_08070 [Candidatus Omnitrophota bacterium]